MPLEELYKASNALGKDGKPLIDYQKKDNKVTKIDQFKQSEMSNDEAESERKYLQTKVDKNNEAARNNPALKDLVDFANHNISRNAGLDSMNKAVKKSKGGKISSASARADGCCIRGKTRG